MISFSWNEIIQSRKNSYLYRKFVFENSNYFSIYAYIYKYIHDVEYLFEYLKEKKLIIASDKLFQSRDASICIAFSKIQTIFPYMHTYINIYTMLNMYLNI